MPNPKNIISIKRKKKQGYSAEETLRRFATGLDVPTFKVKTVYGIITEDKD